MKLTQKHIVKGTREFELTDEGVDIKIDMPFLNKEFTVVYSVLETEPVVDGSSFAFVSGVNREPLVEMVVDKPTAEEFNAFVEELKKRVKEEEFGKVSLDKAERTVNVKILQESLDMLRLYLTGDEYQPLLEAMEAVKAEPKSKERLAELFEIFNNLGPLQGAVLTYAPYISNLLVGDIPDSGGPDAW